MFSSFIISLTPATISVSPFYAFTKSDAVGKAIVILLLIVSIYVWTIMIEKWLFLTKIMKAARKFKKTFRKMRYPLSGYSEGAREISPLGDVYRKGLMNFFHIIKYPNRMLLNMGMHSFPLRD